jgi:hypothetical protein
MVDFERQWPGRTITCKSHVHRLHEMLAARLQWVDSLVGYHDASCGKIIKCFSLRVLSLRVPTLKLWPLSHLLSKEIFRGEKADVHQTINLLA